MKRFFETKTKRVTYRAVLVVIAHYLYNFSSNERWGEIAFPLTEKMKAGCYN